MRLAHFAAFAPHCPVCARDRSMQIRLGLPDATVQPDGTVLSGILVCGDPACRHEYPIIDGIPVLMPDLRQHLGERAIELLLRDDIDPVVLSLLGDALGPDTWFDIIRQGVSTYAWDSYADLDPKELAGTPVPGAASRCLSKMLELAQPWEVARARQVLDIGCAGGRTSFDLAAATGDGLILGIDSNLALLRLAQGVASNGHVAYARRRIGTVYDDRRFAAALPGRERTDFWACDATALPFAAGTVDLVAGLNLLDCVVDPQRLLVLLAALIRDGGALLLATPFDWSTRATPAAGWIGGHSQRGASGGSAEPLLKMLVTEGEHPAAVQGLRLLGIGEAEWHTRLHERSAVQYKSHLLALLKVADSI